MPEKVSALHCRYSAEYYFEYKYLIVINIEAFGIAQIFLSEAFNIDAFVISQIFLSEAFCIMYTSGDAFVHVCLTDDCREHNNVFITHPITLHMNIRTNF